MKDPFYDDIISQQVGRCPNIESLNLTTGVVTFIYSNVLVRRFGLLFISRVSV